MTRLSSRVVGAVALLIHGNPPSRHHAKVRHASATRRIFMLDIIMLALGFGFFVVAVGYTYACERL
jgi:hypothetical protein